MLATAGYNEKEYANSIFIESKLQRLTVLMDFVHEAKKILNRISGATMVDIWLGWWHVLNRG